MMEPYIIFRIKGDVVGMKNLRFEIINGQFQAIADFSGNIEYADGLLRAITNLVKVSFEKMFDDYGVVTPTEPKPDNIVT